MHDLDASPQTLLPVSSFQSADDVARAAHAAMSRAWLSVGIGCRLQGSVEQIEAAVRAALGTYRLDQIRVVASIDSKSRQAGLLEFCTRHALPLVFFSREQIATVPVETPSAAAQTHFGVDGVCEPCALLAAAGELATSQVRLIVRKTIHAGVTVAIATATGNAIQPQDLP
ncbi:cobalamin biosynthesis protein [Paraburkholderia sp. BL21I4N1]|uniref:cobalamin biosynthesis protein n=1 Tax=Paraburkholderia sp. BL21I4N1 TaxID=1938801 RepID=UPI00280ABDEB|nr:cobalamin biosynthesis protein [Paraburkholderia sp. BL21I4N1]